MQTINTNVDKVKAIVSIPGWASRFADGTLYNPESVRTTQDAYSYVPLIFRAVNLRCDTLTSAPVHIYKGDREVDWPFPADITSLLWLTEAAMLLSGAAYWEKAANKVRVKDIHWINPFSMQVKLGKDEEQRDTLVFTQTTSGKPQTFREDEIVYFKEFNPSDDIAPGVSATAAALTNSRLLGFLTTFPSAFFEGGAMPSVLLGIDGLVDKDEKERVQGWFRQRVTGVRNAFRVLAIGTKDISPTTLTPPLKDLSMPDLHKQAVSNVALAFGIPETMIADAANYATAKEHRMSFWQDTIRPRGNKIATTINRQLLDAFGMRLEFGFDEIDIFQEDEERRSQAYWNYTQAGMKPSVAAQILGIDLPAGMEYSELDADIANVNPEIDPMEEGRSPRKNIASELKRWERFVLKRVKEGKKPQREFVSTELPAALMGAIGGQLEMACDEMSVRAIFRDAERWHRYP